METPSNEELLRQAKELEADIKLLRIAIDEIKSNIELIERVTSLNKNLKDALEIIKNQGRLENP